MTSHNSRNPVTLHQTYYLFDRREPEVVRYVGRTSRGAKFRYWSHKNRAKGGERNGSALYSWVAEIGRENLDYCVIQTFDNLDDAMIAEVEAIARFRENGQPILNSTNGGDDRTGRSLRPETRDKISKIRKGKATIPKGTKFPDRQGKPVKHFLEYFEKVGHPKAKLTKEEVLEIRRRYDSGEHPNSIQKDYPVVANNIVMIGKRLTWNSIAEEGS